MRLLLLLLIPAWPAIASQDSLHNDAIRKFRNGIILGPVMKYRYPSIVFTGPVKDFNRMVFRPNSNLVAGFRINIFGINLESARSLTQGFRDPDRYGTTKARDLTFNTMQRRWFGDLQFTRYNGLYYRKSWQSAPDLVTPAREDLRIRNNSLSFTWIFNPERFSYRGAFLFMEQQVRSAGSPLLRVSVSSTGFTGTDPLLGDPDLVNFPGMEQVTGIHHTALGIAPGYSYTWVWKDFFINGTLVAGAAHYWARYEQAGKPDRYDIQFNFVSTLGMAAGYNGNKWFAGITYRGQGFRLKRDNIQITGSQNAFNILAGIRLLERGIFTKRANDLKGLIPDRAGIFK